MSLMLAHPLHPREQPVPRVSIVVLPIRAVGHAPHETARGLGHRCSTYNEEAALFGLAVVTVALAGQLAAPLSVMLPSMFGSAQEDLDLSPMRVTGRIWIDDDNCDGAVLARYSEGFNSLGSSCCERLMDPQLQHRPITPVVSASQGFRPTSTMAVVYAPTTRSRKPRQPSRPH